MSMHTRAWDMGFHAHTCMGHGPSGSGKKPGCVVVVVVGGGPSGGGKKPGCVVVVVVVVGGGPSGGGKKPGSVTCFASLQVW